MARGNIGCCRKGELRHGLALRTNVAVKDEELRLDTLMILVLGDELAVQEGVAASEAPKSCPVDIERHVNHEELAFAVTVSHHAQTIRLIGYIVARADIGHPLHLLLSHILNHHGDRRNTTEPVGLCQNPVS